MPVKAQPADDDSLPKQRRRSVLYNLILVGISLLAGLIISEFGLRAFEKARLHDRNLTSALISDPLLGQRVAPFTLEHDANGFRNDSVPNSADIVVLGDSQTWGTNVLRGDAWPQQLTRLSGRSVYNMGMAGYGPVQYWALTDKALTLSPKVIVLGIYFGNDLYDAFFIAYSNENYRELRNATIDHEVLADTVSDRANLSWDKATKFHNDYGSAGPSGWSLWLRGHSAIGRLLNRTGWWPGSSDIDYDVGKAWARAYPNDGAVCEDEKVRTVLTTTYRMIGVDLDDPAIADGHRITAELLSRIKSKTDDAGAQLVILLIPTKESVYADRMESHAALPETYARLVKMEARIRSEMMTQCAAKKVQCVDALPPLRQAIERNEQIFPSTIDGHFNARGYNVLASVVEEAIKRLDR